MLNSEVKKRFDKLVVLINSFRISNVKRRSMIRNLNGLVKFYEEEVLFSRFLSMVNELDEQIELNYMEKWIKLRNELRERAKC
jgi:uncharacterized protein YaeQ